MREAVLAVLRAAGTEMTTNEVRDRLLDIGETVTHGDPIYSLNVLARGPEVVRVGHRGGRPSGEVVWRYRVPDSDCINLDEEE